MIVKRCADFYNNQLTRSPGRDEQEMSRQHDEVSLSTNRESTYNRTAPSISGIAPATVCLATRFPPRFVSIASYHHASLKIRFHFAACPISG